MRMQINASELADDPEVADYLFETAGCDTNDPLVILTQRELEQEQDGEESWFTRSFN